MIQIENLLRERMGLDSASIGSTLIERTIRLRMKGRNVKKFEDYWKVLHTSSTELAELIESVVVTETWFFRDQEPFNALIKLVMTEWLPTHPFATLRLLSVPCSSGEEPYSLAMALLDAGVPEERFQIDAVDISTRALARARKAVYGKNSFRSGDLSFRDRHFQPTKDGYLLHPSVRRRVRFQKGNLFDENCFVEKGVYDFIFFRNLLIYFDRPTQGKALKKLEELLTPAGMCFVGPAELPLVMDYGFVSANIPMAFACRKADALAKPRHPPQRSRTPKFTAPQPPPLSPIAPTPARPKRRRTPRVETKVPPPVKNGEPASADLEAARRLADEGKLAEAATLCEAHLRERGASAPAYYLLGLVRDATGDAQAIDYYRKALYLEPNHHETLLQMALWSEKNGDATQARLLRKRARKATKTEV